MLCPVCKMDMFALEYDFIEVDYCMQCGGVWLDSGELELVGEKAGAIQGELLAALEESVGKPLRRDETRHCPVCNKKLKQMIVEGENTIMLDTCSRQHGIWFDKGELHTVVVAAGAEKDNKLASFFADLEAAAGGGSENEENQGD